MSYTIRDNAHAILIPAFADTHLSDAVKRFLSNGGCSVLVGESREEYVAREMSADRRQREKAGTIIDLVHEAKSLSGDVVVAVDQEISGICRLHDLVPPYPSRERIKEISSAAFEEIITTIAGAAKELGVNCFLGPVLDIVTGKNPWLEGRTWSLDPERIAELSSSFIRALQTNGIAATAKHFPGYSSVTGDPAIDPDARSKEPRHSFRDNFIPFAEAINNGVEIVMTGPAIVEAFDAEKAASISPAVIRVLREDLGFNGVVMSDDLDAKAILREQSIHQAAVEALKAGSDYLLVADIDDHIDLIVSAIVRAVQSGDLDEERLGNAAEKVRSLAAAYGS